MSQPLEGPNRPSDRVGIRYLVHRAADTHGPTPPTRPLGGKLELIARRMAAVVALTVLGVVLLTWWALEWSGIAILETRSADGAVRSTHVWYAEPHGELWIEAGTPENDWYVDVQEDPRVSFSALERSGEYVAQTISGHEAHLRIRDLLREKYGFRDWWIGVLFDTSQSVAVRMVSQSPNSRPKER